MTTQQRTCEQGCNGCDECMDYYKPQNSALAVPITEVKQYSEYGQFAVGDYVTRDGSDVQFVKDMNDDGFCATFVCVVAPESGWCAVGEDEYNLCRRYSRVNYTPKDAP